MAVSQRPALLLALVTLCLAPALEAACVNHSYDNPQLRATNVFVNLSGLSGSKRTQAQRGLNQWNGCSTPGNDLPHMTAQNPGSDFRQVNVVMANGSHPDGDVCGTFQGQTITVYETARTDDNQLVSCRRSDIFEDTIAHELGHVLGFGHPTGGNCSSYIMAPIGIHSGGVTARSVQQAECDMAAEMIVTQQEMDEQQEDNETYNSPILLDLDRNQFRLSDDRVYFDFDGDGRPEHTNWTRGDQQDAFLCWDRNRNGRIDSGQELFGDRTPLANGQIARHGYEALAELDSGSLGGDGNGLLDARDPTFAELCLWLDRDHDGASSPRELSPLRDSLVLWVGSEYKSHEMLDEFGNLFLFWGRALVDERSGPAVIWTTDVFFRGEAAD